MARAWEQMKEAEKIEDLRGEMLRLLHAVDRLNTRSAVLERGMSDLTGKLRGLEIEVVKFAFQKPKQRPRAGKAGGGKGGSGKGGGGKSGGGKSRAAKPRRKS